MPNLTTNLLILAVILIVLPTETYAFGAGDIPDFAYLNGMKSRLLLPEVLTCIYDSRQGIQAW